MGMVMAERAVGMVMARMSILLIMVMAVPMTVIMMGGMIMPMTMTMTGFVVMLVAHWRALSSVCVPAMLRHGTRTFSGWGHAARMGHPH